MLALGFLAALFVSVGVAVAAEYLNPPIREQASLYELLGVPGPGFCIQRGRSGASGLGRRSGG
jgi:capsular polysaccharide biosynthesis protein